MKPQMKPQMKLKWNPSERKVNEAQKRTPEVSGQAKQKIVEQGSCEKKKAQKIALSQISRLMPNDNCWSFHYSDW